MITPNTTGHQLLSLCTGQYTCLHISNRWVWVWRDRDEIHISDAIRGQALHLVGKLSDKISQFRQANGQAAGRAELIRQGYSVELSDDLLVVKKGKQIVYSHHTDGDSREDWRYVTRGWRVARLHSQGKELSSEEYWWAEVIQPVVTEHKPFVEMSKDELDEWRRQ